MNKTPLLMIWALGIALWMSAGCSSTSPQYEYITGVDLVGERSVKYLYVPGESSSAGEGYRDQAIAVEICDIEEQGGHMVETNCERSRLLKTEEYR